MIFVSPDQQTTGLTPRAPPDPVTPTDPSSSLSWGDTFGAAYGLQNDVVNAFDLLTRPTFTPQPDYNPIDDPAVKGTVYEQQHLDNFVGSQSPDETRSIIARINRENRQRQTVHDAGIWGVLASMAAGGTSPLMFIPLVGWLSRGAGLARAGRAALAAGEAGLSTAAVVAAQEGVLQAAQETRTPEESAWAIAGGAVLGAVLGGAAGALTSKQLEELTFRIGQELNGPRGYGAGLVSDAPSAGGAAAGAQVATAARGTGELAGTFGVAKTLRFMNPALRTQTSDNPATRNVVRDLIAGDRLEENALGIASSEGGAVEVQAALWHGNKAEVTANYRRLYSDYFFGKQVPMPAGVGAVARVFGLNRRMSYYEFAQAVSDAALHGDEHVIPQVAEAARIRRETLVNPLRDEAMLHIKGFKELVDAATADQSYLTRIWNRAAVKAGFNEIKDILATHFADQQALWMRSAANRGAEYGSDILTRQDFESMADDTIANILGQSPGRIGMMPGEFAVGPRGPLKERMLRTLPTTSVLRFVEKDIERIDSAYVRSMAADIALTKKFGSITMEGQIAAVLDDANRMKVGKTEKQVAKIDAQFEADKRDILGMRDIIRGTYKLPDNPDGLLHRSITTGKTLNFLASLGMMTVSSLSDLGKPIMVHGLMRAMGVPLKAMAGGMRAIKLAARDVRLSGQALDMITADRFLSFAELVDEYSGRTPFERGVQGAGRAFGVLTLMSPWNTVVKQWAGITSMTRALQAADALAKGGRAAQRDVTWMAENGVNAPLAERIASQFDQHGVKDGAVWAAQMEKWTDKQARDALRALVNRDVNRIIVTPGVGDKPLMGHGDLGSVILQFQSFAISSVQRTLLSGLAQRDMAVMNGVMVMLGLGAMSYWAKSVIGGYEVSDDPRVWAAEAVDNSGVLGVLMNADHALEKLTSDRFGISALTGQPARRYVNVNKLGAFLGPSLGRASDILDIFDSIANQGRQNPDGSVRTLTASDVHKIRRMMPLQNLFITRQGFDAMENGINNAFGIPMRRAR